MFLTPFSFYDYARNDPTTLSDLLGLLASCPTDCPDYTRNFFNTFKPVFEDMASQTGADPAFFAALSSYESGWLGQHAQDFNNPFGLTNAGGKDLSFSSYSQAEQYWLYSAGRNGGGYADVVNGDNGSISEFAQDLHDAGYNNKTGTWTQDVINQLKSVKKWMKICHISL
jgi:hypothetical protein